MIKYNILSFTFSLLISFNCNSQSNNWEFYKSLDGVEVFTMKVNCVPKKGGFDMDLILFKISNTNSTSKAISWKEALWYNNKCITCNSNSAEYLRELSLPPNAELIGKCEDYDHPFLSLFVKFTDKNYKNDNFQVLTKFELEDFKVE